MNNNKSQKKISNINFSLLPEKSYSFFEAILFIIIGSIVLSILATGIYYLGSYLSHFVLGRFIEIIFFVFLLLFETFIA